MSNTPAKLPDVSEDTLAEVPARALKLLVAIGTSVQIRAALATRGYDSSDHARGWSLLHAVARYAPPEAQAELTSEVARAVRTLDEWDEDGLALVDGTLESNFPEQHAWVFRGGLKAARGKGSVLVVKTLLERLDELESGKGREGSAEADAKALALLAKRGLDAGERARLRALAEQAEALDPTPAIPDNKAEHEADIERRRALYAWVSEWSKLARTVIKRRDYLVRMGLAKPKARKKGDAQPDGG